ncbi:hypothetical protein ACFFR3_01100 [Nonomuraea salmonea]|uniref:Uncharacterized protein n=2 Tax=Nonomuraea salmonea TaxID=46181 RepID=A0ABV5NCQ8_9ACTN
MSVRRRPRATREVGIQMERFRRFWSWCLDALGTELAGARREHHHPLDEPPGANGRPDFNDEEEDDE